MNRQRRIGRSGLFLFIVGGCFLIFAIQPAAPIKKIVLPANEDMSMDGLIFDHYEAGRRLFSVKAAKFSLGKAKVGFFISVYLKVPDSSRWK